MPATTNQGGSGIYLTIIKGKIKQRADENTPGAEKREYELKDGTKGEKWEISHQGWMGKVNQLKLKTTEFGEVLDIVLEDANLSLSLESRYFADFVKKFASSDQSKEISINPYDFVTEDGKRKTGLTLIQNNEKLSDYFYNWDTKEYKNGFPQPEGDEKTSDDWKIYFLKVKKFLKKWIEENPITIRDEAEEVDIDAVNQPTGTGTDGPLF